MAKDGFGKGLRDRLQGAARSAREAAEGIDLSGVRDRLQDAVHTAKDAADGVSLSEVRDRIQEAGGAMAGTVRKAVTPKKAAKDNGSEADGAAGDRPVGASAHEGKAVEGGTPRVTAIPTREAIKIIYYLMAADGTIYHGEEEKFDSIGSELDPRFAESRDSIVAECQAQLGRALDPEDHYDVLQEGVDDALEDSSQADNAFITPKLLVWDLLTVAHSDESYDEAERRLVKHIVRKTGIDNAVFLEMESGVLTLMDIERELAWIKTTNRPYLTIEATVNELADRKNVIFESVKDLIFL